VRATFRLDKKTSRRQQVGPMPPVSIPPCTLLRCRQSRITPHLAMQSVQEAPGSWYGSVRQVHGQSTMFVQVLSQGRVVLHHEITTFLELPRFTFEPPSSLHCCTVSHDLRKVACSLLRLWRRSPSSLVLSLVLHQNITIFFSLSPLLNLFSPQYIYYTST
jgi:hypothetical protein